MIYHFLIWIYFRKYIGEVLTIKKIHIVTLGCSKNVYDSELLGGFKRNNFEITNEPLDADYVIVNTCGFLIKLGKRV